ncbi:hypothetical protein C8J57DRAFT_1514400 [Mycena rebaudengoi]|nr:hypothetical protein C8J57DRAFT_1514400 [Mycena rebaudengoi]
MFPPELVAAVIDQIGTSVLDYLDSDFHLTLRSCALVSQSFAEASQRRLFCELHIGDFNDPESSRSPDTTRRLAQVLISRPHLASYVRLLAVSGKCFDHTSLILIISSLQNLRHFTLTGAPLLELPALRHISMRDVSFDNWHDLESFLGRCPQLRSVKMRDLHFGEHPLPSQLEIVPTRPVVLESLNVRGAIPPMSSRGGPLDIFHLRSLYLTYSSGSSMRSLILANSSSLRHLSVTVGYTGTVFHEDAEVMTCAEHLVSIRE